MIMGDGTIVLDIYEQRLKKNTSCNVSQGQIPLGQKSPSDKCHPGTKMSWDQKTRTFVPETIVSRTNVPALVIMQLYTLRTDFCMNNKVYVLLPQTILRTILGLVQVAATECWP